MIIVDFLTLRMPGMLDQLSISIIYQKIGKEEVSISFEEVIEFQSQDLIPHVGSIELPSKIILPECFKSIKELEQLHTELNCFFQINLLFFIDLKKEENNGDDSKSLSLFPNLVKDLPAKATKIITRLMN